MTSIHRGGTVTDTPTESTAAELRRHYRRQHPLFDTYLAVVEERNRDDRPITEPFDPPHGVTNREAMQIALRRLNMPHDDVIAKMGEAFIEVLEGEIRELAVDKPTLDDVVIETLFPAAGCLPTPGDWQGEDDDEKAAVAAEIVPRLTDDMLRDLVVTAMPTVLARIIDRDADCRALEDRVFEIGDRVRVSPASSAPALPGTVLRQAADTDDRCYRVALDGDGTYSVPEGELESEDDRDADCLVDARSKPCPQCIPCPAHEPTSRSS